MKKCVTCGKNSETTSGWHLRDGLDFCSNECVAAYLERGLKEIEVPHKKTKMLFLGLREDNLPTYLCPACGCYIQFGHQKMEGYCIGDRSEFK